MRRSGFGMHRTVLCVALGALLGGCRDQPPPAPFPTDLGEGGELLMPVPVKERYLPPTLVTGSAQLQPLDFDRIGQDKGEGETSADASTAAERYPEVVQGVQELIQAFNDKVASGSTEGLDVFFVESLRDEARAQFELVERFLGSVNGFVDVLAKADSTTGQMIKASLAGAMNIPAMLTIQVKDIVPTSETQAGATIVTLGGKEEDVTFVLVNGQWLMKDEPTEQERRQIEMLASVSDELDALTEKVESGEVSPQMAMPQFGQIMMKLQAAGAGGGAGGQPSADASAAAQRYPEVVQGVQDVIKAFNDKVATGSVEGLEAFSIPERREVAKQHLAVVGRMFRLMAAFDDALQKADPATGPILNILNKNKPMLDMALAIKVKDIVPISATEAEVTVIEFGGKERTELLRRVNGEWLFVDEPEPGDDQKWAAMSAVLDEVDALTKKLASGDVPPQTAMQQYTQLMMKLHMAGGGGGVPGQPPTGGG